MFVLRLSRLEDVKNNSRQLKVQRWKQMSDNIEASVLRGHQSQEGSKYAVTEMFNDNQGYNRSYGIRVITIRFEAISQHRNLPFRTSAAIGNNKALFCWQQCYKACTVPQALNHLADKTCSVLRSYRYAVDS
jgi:hypothetical protein